MKNILLIFILLFSFFSLAEDDGLTQLDSVIIGKKTSTNTKCYRVFKGTGNIRPAVCFDTGLSKWRLSNDGTTFSDIATGAGTYTDPTTTAGDLPYRNSSGNLDRLPVGNDGEVLTISNPTTIEYSSRPGTIYYSEFAGAGCAVGMGSVTNASFANTSALTCSNTERYKRNIGTVTQASNQYGLTVDFTREGTYRICSQFYYETQLQGTNPRISTALRWAFCSGSSACAITGDTYYYLAFVDNRDISSAEVTLRNFNMRRCFITDITTPGTYTFHIQKKVENASGITTVTNDLGCNEPNNGCSWEIEQMY